MSRAPGPWLSYGASGCRDPNAVIPQPERVVRVQENGVPLLSPLARRAG